ncbi:MAG: OmpA family protein [Bacteroidales bacterium]
MLQHLFSSKYIYIYSHLFVFKENSSNFMFYYQSNYLHQKKTTMKKCLALMLLFSSFIIGSAQNVDQKWSLELQLGKNEYYGDLQNQWLFKDKVKDYHYLGGIALNHYLNKSFDLGLAGTYGRWAGTIPSSNYNTRFSGILLDGSLNLKLKLNNGYFLKENAKLAPFITAGIGYANFSNYKDNKNTNPEAGSNIIIPIGAGLKYNLTKSIALQYLLTHNFNLSDRRDNILKMDGKNDNFLRHTLSIVFSFGTPKDTDKDGVIDRLDLCPGTPAMVSVTPTGCPIDSDGDGVADYLDKCPNTATGVKVTEAGCPVDSDGDGIEDSKDKCPNEKGLASLGGCPDADKDGVADKNDACPNTPANVKVDSKGCPIDTDGDGIADYLDKCPTVKGTKEFNGCPDTDGDGIPDNLDKCPTVKGTKENKGCPEIKKEVKEVFKKALQGIQFETGKDVIRKTSNAILDNIVGIMKTNPAYKITINGHTDNVGKPESNLVLSQKRADAVKNYMIANGVAAERMTAVGLGDTTPVADNATPAGRTLNRRVEFIVEF